MRHSDHTNVPEQLWIEVDVQYAQRSVRSLSKTRGRKIRGQQEVRCASRRETTPCTPYLAQKRGEGRCDLVWNCLSCHLVSLNRTIHRSIINLRWLISSQIRGMAEVFSSFSSKFNLLAEIRKRSGRSEGGRTPDLSLSRERARRIGLACERGRSDTHGRNDGRRDAQSGRLPRLTT